MALDVCGPRRRIRIPRNPSPELFYSVNPNTVVCGSYNSCQRMEGERMFDIPRTRTLVPWLEQRHLRFSEVWDWGTLHVSTERGDGIITPFELLGGGKCPGEAPSLRLCFDPEYVQRFQKPTRVRKLFHRGRSSVQFRVEWFEAKVAVVEE